MNKKCIGCGSVLQNSDITLEGYTPNLDNQLCMRCFKIKNYGEYSLVVKDNNLYVDILKEIDNDLVLHVVDLLNIPKDLDEIEKCFNSKNVILVLNKRDALPLNLNNNKIISFFKERYSKYLDIIVISSKKNYNIDYLVDSIYKYKTSNKVYIVGNTNTGKSSLINSLLKLSKLDQVLTISPIPSTTLNTVSLRLFDDLTVIDTPGLIDSGDITNYLDKTVLKKLINKREIRPKTFQIKDNESLLIEDFIRIDYKGNLNSITLYIPNSVSVKKINGLKHNYLMNNSKKSFNVSKNSDLVIPGIGFLKIVKECSIDVYTLDDVNIYIRDNFI